MSLTWGTLHSEDGEGKLGCNALSVTCGDSSPKGRAKGVYRGTKNGAHLPCLSLWERRTSKARTERENRDAMPSQSPAATALPKGEPGGAPRYKKWSISLPICSIDLFSGHPSNFRVAFSFQTNGIIQRSRCESTGIW